jgi:hypothetical protein
LEVSDLENLACVSTTGLDIVPYLFVWTTRHVSSVGADCLEFSRPEEEAIGSTETSLITYKNTGCYNPTDNNFNFPAVVLFVPGIKMNIKRNYLLHGAESFLSS